MSNVLETLIKYFPSGRAETEKDFLGDVFVLPGKFTEMITPAERSCRILVGKKGSGKSALLNVLIDNSNRAGIPSILIKPDDISEFFEVGAKDLGSMKRGYYNALIYSIGIKIGEHLSGFLSESDNNLLQMAIDKGVKSRDGIKKILSILMPVGKAVSNVDFKSILPSNVPNTRVLSDNIKERLGSDNHIFFLGIDDTDQIANPGEDFFLEKIWAIILAAQKVAEEIPHIKPIISLRWEIWSRLTSDDHGARDQIDHFRPMVRDLNPTNEELGEILDRRLDIAVKNIRPKQSDSYNTFFEGKSVTLPFSKETRDWKTFIVTSSRFRPRDTVQFVNSLASFSIESGKGKIAQDIVDVSSLKYSKERVEDLVNENEYVCKQLEVILKSFHKCDFEMDTETVKTHIHNLTGLGLIKVSKSVVKQTDESSIFALWKLLYDIEFLTPRMPDVRKVRGFRHISPRHDKNLVDPSRWTDMQKCAWDIHPAYRSFLIEVKKSEEMMALAREKEKTSDESGYKAGAIRKNRR
ncbi:MAG: hypothetical protein FPO08_05260 [Geobacter sp.]|nr:MAG: hypothetical protein FPO08_05260 [Geobacter sp.]